MVRCARTKNTCFADAMQLCISVVIKLSRSVVVRTVHMRKHIIPVTRTKPYFDFRCEHDFRSWLIAMIEWSCRMSFRNILHGVVLKEYQTWIKGVAASIFEPLVFLTTCLNLSKPLVLDRFHYFPTFLILNHSNLIHLRSNATKTTSDHALPRTAPDFVCLAVWLPAV